MDAKQWCVKKSLVAVSTIISSMGWQKYKVWLSRVCDAVAQKHGCKVSTFRYDMAMWSNKIYEIIMWKVSHEKKMEKTEVREKILSSCIYQNMGRTATKIRSVIFVWTFSSWEEAKIMFWSESVYSIAVWVWNAHVRKNVWKTLMWNKSWGLDQPEFRPKVSKTILSVSYVGGKNIKP